VFGKKALYSGIVEHPRIVFLFFFLQARPLLDRYASELVDPRLRISGYDEYEMHCMMHAASQCIKKDPTMRPRMTQVNELKPCCIILFPHQAVKNLHARRACILVERMLTEKIAADNPLFQEPYETLSNSFHRSS
jgi:hypothetical protein